MKIYKLFYVVIFLSLFSCEEKDIDVFNGDKEIYFDKFFMDEFAPGEAEKDSTECSFFFYPDGTQTIKASLIVCLSGEILEEDANFKLKVVEDETTAIPNEYTIADSYTFHANNIAPDAVKVTDTIDVDLHLSDRLSSLDNGAILVVELVPNDVLKVGQHERRKAKIIITTKAAKPDWWTSEVTKNLLGEYSQKKYKLFLNNVDVNAEMSLQLIENDPSKPIDLAMKFKKWLSEQDPKILEDDGTEMSVKI